MSLDLDLGKKITVLSILVVLIIGLNIHIQISNTVGRSDDIGKIYLERDEARDVIRINNNSDLEIFADEMGLKGNGSEYDPYLMYNYRIDAGEKDNAIFIGNTSLHLTIKDCSLFNSSSELGAYPTGAGISLYRVENCSLVDNNCTDNSKGVIVESSSSIKVIDNVVTRGMIIEDSTNLVLKDNTILERNGIVLDHSSDNRLYDNELIGCSLSLYGSREDFTSQEIPVNNTVNGRPIYYYKNRDMENLAVPSNAGEVITGNVTGLKIEGLVLKNGMISIGYSSQISIINNLCSYTIEGISVYSSSDIYIEDNTLKKDHVGIYLSGSENNHISQNYFEENHQDGIYLDTGSNKNKIDNNTFDNCGISLYDVDNNLLIFNLICKNNDFGMVTQSGCQSNRIFQNAFMFNKGSNRSYNESHIQAKDESGNNLWNSSENFGNYWLDWTSPDDDADGVVDTPYKLHGAGSYDRYPLVEPPMAVIPSKPINLSIEPGQGTLDLSWETPDDDGGSPLLGYKIYRENQTEELREIVKVEAETVHFTDTGVKNGVEYTYRMTAYNDVGESVLTEEVRGTPDGGPPELRVEYPSNNSFINSSSFTVRWNGTDPNSGVNRYEIRVDDESWSNIGKNNTYHLSNLTEGDHSIAVRAVDNAGNKKTVWRGFVIDMTNPELLSYSPRGDYVPLNFEIVLNFSEVMDRRSIEINISNGVPLEIEWVTNHSLVAVPNTESSYGMIYEVSVNGTDRAGNPLDEINWTFKITTNGTVTGRLINEDGEPIIGATITLSGGIEDMTDNKGRYILEAPAGEYEITFSKEGYKDRTETVKIEPGKEITLEEEKLRPTSSIYDWLLIVFSLIIVISGIIAFAVFMLKEEEEEFEEGELEEEEDVEEVPPEFLE